MLHSISSNQMSHGLCFTSVLLKVWRCSVCLPLPCCWHTERAMAILCKRAQMLVIIYFTGVANL